MDAAGGISFAIVGKHRSAIFQQLDGSIELAGVCNCFTFWDPDFRIEFRRDCPIDDHKIRAAQAEVAA